MSHTDVVIEKTGTVVATGPISFSIVKSTPFSFAAPEAASPAAAIAAAVAISNKMPLDRFEKYSGQLNAGEYIVAFGTGDIGVILSATA